MKYPPPSTTQYSSTLDYINGNNSAESSSSGDTNKLKLFGFEFDPNAPGPIHNHPNQNHSPAAEGDESVNSSTTVQIVNSAAGPKRTTPLRCEYCMKEFGNSQALGGHQNAHKKERMKKKRVQLQARRATISSFYLHAPNPTTSSSTRWFYDPASSCDDVINYYNNNNNEFTVYEETPPLQESGRQISFNDHPDYFSAYDVNNHQGGFTLTHHRPVVGGGGRSGNAVAAAGSTTGRTDLDLQLGLRLQ